MQSVTNDSFGPLIAYLVPGATVLLGTLPHSTLLQRWFASTPPDAPTLGGFLFLTVAALATGMTVSAIRWVFVDNIHRMTGLAAPKLDFSRLPTREQAFTILVEMHYRHYQFYANMLVAVAIAYVGYRTSTFAAPLGWLDIGVAALEVIFFWTSRDTVRKYYTRSQQLLAGGK